MRKVFRTVAQSHSRTVAQLSLLYLLLLCFIIGCKKDQFNANPNLESPTQSAERFDDAQARVIQEVKDSLIQNPQTVTFINELGSLDYDNSIVHVLGTSVFIIQIPILSAGKTEVVNLFEVVKMEGKTYNKLHQKDVMSILKKSGKYQNHEAYFDNILAKFEVAQKAQDRYLTLKAVFNDGSYITFNPDGSIIGHFNHDGTTANPNAGCHVGGASGLQYYVLDGVQHAPPGPIPSNPPGLLTVPIYNQNYHFQFTNEGIWVLMQGLPPTPPIIIDPGLSDGSPLGPQGVPMNILQRAKQSIQATYGISFDINFLIQFFGLECIMHIGTTASPSTPYLESGCIEDVLSQSQLVSSFFQEQYFKETGINIIGSPFELAVTNCPNIHQYNVYRTCATQAISSFLSTSLLSQGAFSISHGSIQTLFIDFLNTKPLGSSAQLLEFVSLASSLSNDQFLSLMSIAIRNG
jgi:hypothetical protein